MVDNSFKSKSVISLYSTTWLYSVLFTIVAIVIDHSIFNGTIIIKSLIPFSTMSLWFATIYIELLLISPFLNKAFSLPERKLKYLVMLLFLMIVFMSTIHSFADTFLCALTYFAFIYLFMGYYKKYLIDKVKIKGMHLLVVGVALYVIMVFSKFVCIQNSNGIFVLGEQLISQYLSDYKSLPNFIISLLIFTSFAKFNIDSNNAINRIAKSAFGVYVIHQVPAFHDVMWFKIFKCRSWLNSSHYIIYYFCIVLVIYFVCMVIDEVRRNTLESIWVKSKMFQYLERVISKSYV